MHSFFARARARDGGLGGLVVGGAEHPEPGVPADAVVEALDVLDIRDIYEAFDRVGADPDLVRRDEVIQRFRALGSIEADATALPLLRGDIERYLREAGIDPADTPVPHDVTDPEVLTAITAYRRAGTLAGAAEILGVSGETVRRRIARANLRVEEIDTDEARRIRQQTVEARHAADRNLAASARALGIDPRTVRERLLRHGISERSIGTPAPSDSADLRELQQALGSADAVAAYTGQSVAAVRRALAPASPGAPRGRRRVSAHDLDQAELALAEHGSIRAAARAPGISPGGLQHRLRLTQARHTGPRNARRQRPRVRLKRARHRETARAMAQAIARYGDGAQAIQALEAWM